MTNKLPKITVLMSVYNGEKYLHEAIDSILKQSFADFEFLIIDDASTDRTPKILQSYEDPRIRITRNNENLGLTKSLNIGLKLAKGEYIARMDADDISLPHRLEKQIAFMDANPEIGVCGTWLETIGGDSNSVWAPPIKHDDIITGMLFDNMIYHPTVVIRKETIFKRGEFYDEQYKQSQDMEYWVRLSKLGVKFANIDEVFLKHRLHETNVGKTHNGIQKKNADTVRWMQFRHLGIELTEDDKIIYNILKEGISSNTISIEKVSQLIGEIQEANNKKGLVSEHALSQELAKRWFRLCYNSSSNGLSVWSLYYANQIASHLKLRIITRFHFFVKCLLHLY